MSVSPLIPNKSLILLLFLDLRNLSMFFGYLVIYLLTIHSAVCYQNILRLLNFLFSVSNSYNLIFYFPILQFCFLFNPHDFSQRVLKWLLPKVLGFAIKLFHVPGTLHALYLLIFSITLWRKLFLYSRLGTKIRRIPFPTVMCNKWQNQTGIEIGFDSKAKPVALPS